MAPGLVNTQEHTSHLYTDTHIYVPENMHLKKKYLIFTGTKDLEILFLIWFSG